MGKKKTKEVSVAIAESSSMGSEVQITPRKRGRPRKIVEKTESGEVREELAQEEEEEKKESKKANKMSEEEEQRRTEEQSTASYPVTTKEEGGGEPAGRELPKGPTSSRARRKSKPRKSS